MTKRQKISHSSIVIEHPHGVKPLGNYWMDSLNGQQEIRSLGLGQFKRFQDDFLIQFLTNYLSPKDVCIMSQTSRALYIFCYFDQLWKEFCLEAFPNFTWKFNWRNTFKFNVNKDLFVQDVALKTKGLYSDFLFASWQCTSLPLESLCFIENDNFEKRANLSLQEFKKDYAETNKPVVITDIVKTWPAFTKWSLEFL